MFSSCIQAARRLWARFLASGKSETGLPRLYFQKSQHMQEERVSGRRDFSQTKKTFSHLGKENGSTLFPGISWRTWLEMKENGHEVTQGGWVQGLVLTQDCSTLSMVQENQPVGTV